MTLISLAEAQSNLADLVHRLVPGEEIVITENDRPIARLVASDDVAEHASVQVSNAHLLEIGKSHRPPASWYESDEENLF